MNLENIVEPLLHWYQKNKRILPWRETKNPYHIWISEIMLQQTRIEAVKNYYARFIQEISDIYTLANIEEEKLLKLWEGLGYYNRARNLKKAAIQIENDYQGKMPNSYDQLLQLAGIGEYTAGAIASIAYNEKVPAVDGNVLRVISRAIGSKKNILLPDTKKEIIYQLKTMMPEEAGDFNEALMELGELVCLPNGEPNCKQCPLQNQCVAYQKNLIAEIPVREKKLKRRQEEKTVFVLIDKDGKVAIHQREKKGILAGMYEFPNYPQRLEKQDILDLLKQWNLDIKEIQFLGKYKHVFTHIDWNMEGYQIKIKKPNQEFLWVSEKELESKYALPTAFKYFWTQHYLLESTAK